MSWLLWKPDVLGIQDNCFFCILKMRLLQIYAIEDGEAQSAWENIAGQVPVLSPGKYGYIDWTMYVCFFSTAVSWQLADITHKCFMYT